MTKIKNYFIITLMKSFFFFWPFATSAIITLTRHSNVMDQNDTIEKLGTK